MTNQIVSDLEKLIAQRDTLAKQLVTVRAENEKLRREKVEVEIRQEVMPMDDFMAHVKFTLAPRKYTLVLRYKGSEFKFDGWEYQVQRPV
jgi:hypothetical protein